MNFFKNFYIRMVEWFVTCLASATARTMRHLIVLKGKNPDFVAPPSEDTHQYVAPYTPFDPARAEQTITRFNNTQRPSWTGYESWVTNFNQHPVLKARSQFESARGLIRPADYTEPQPPELTGDELLQLLHSSGRSPVSEEWTEVVKLTVEAEKQSVTQEENK